MTPPAGPDPEPHPAADTLLAALRAAVGAPHVLTEDDAGGDLTPWTVDWRRRYHGRARAVVLPGSADEVAAVVRACAAHGAAIVPQGGNTGTVGGSVPDGSGRQVLLSLRRLQRIHHVDTANLTLTAEAGCTLAQVQQAAADAGLLFPLSLASEGSCTLGGNLASNAGGTQVLRYGNARELCLGLEVVTADGEIWSSLCGLRKDNSGYALRDLFIGSEGTLGVITAATLRLYPQPRSVQTALLGCTSLAHCVGVLQRLQAALGASLTAFEVMNAASLGLVAAGQPELALPWPTPPWTVLAESADALEEPLARARLESALHTLLEDGLASDATPAQSLQQAQAMWARREAIPLAQARAGLNVKHDIALPVSALPGFCDEVGPRLLARWPGVGLITFGHLGDGNLHFNVQAPPGDDGASFLASHEAEINELVFDTVVRLGGSIAAEHGIGQLRRAELARHKPAVALRLMRAVKAALDPQGLMNPGKLL